MRICDIKQKEIININDGRRFGFLSDIEIDQNSGRIEKIIIPASGKILGVFGQEKEYCIPWHEIRQIGEDIILVDVNTEKILEDSQNKWQVIKKIAIINIIDINETN